VETKHSKVMASCFRNTSLNLKLGFCHDHHDHHDLVLGFALRVCVKENPKNGLKGHLRHSWFILLHHGVLANFMTDPAFPSKIPIPQEQKATTRTASLARPRNQSSRELGRGGKTGELDMKKPPPLWGGSGVSESVLTVVEFGKGEPHIAFVEHSDKLFGSCLAQVRDLQAVRRFISSRFEFLHRSNKIHVGNLGFSFLCVIHFPNSLFKISSTAFVPCSSMICASSLGMRFATVGPLRALRPPLRPRGFLMLFISSVPKIVSAVDIDACIVFFELSCCLFPVDMVVGPCGVFVDHAAILS
jgi:hypothetical protein